MFDRPDRWGQSRILSVADCAPLDPTFARSYINDRQVLIWRPRLDIALSYEGMCAGRQFACDGEDLARPARWLANSDGLSPRAWLAKWTVLEVLAKLWNVPVFMIYKSFRRQSFPRMSGLYTIDRILLLTLHRRSTVATFGWNINSDG